MRQVIARVYHIWLTSKQYNLSIAIYKPMRGNADHAVLRHGRKCIQIRSLTGEQRGCAAICVGEVSRNIAGLGAAGLGAREWRQDKIRGISGILNGV